MGHLQTSMKILALGLPACALVLMPTSPPARAAGQTKVGVIQYNAKGGQGGWTTKGGWNANENIRARQIQMIIDEIKALQKNGDPIDFITMEQADVPLLDGDLAKAGLTGWTSMISRCKDDEVQLTRSADWTLVSKTATADGCWETGRPYDIAYFTNTKTGIAVLYVIVHLPHIKYEDCGYPINPSCFADWDVSGFIKDVAKVVGPNVTDLTKVNLIVSGDMNELGRDGNSKDFANLFSQFGPVTKSDDIDTCCEDNGFSDAFDHVATNRGPLSTPVIVDDGVYPFNPHFNNRICPAKSKPHPKPYCPHNEEHKAMYGAVTLPTP